MDVTASMNSELASLNWWIFNNKDTMRITSYSFFNDGNNMADKKKRIGSIGGFYQAIFIELILIEGRILFVRCIDIICLNDCDLFKSF
jgi:hypothetical protein